MNLKEKEVLKVVLQDVENLNIDREKDDNIYYLELIKGNIKDLIRGVLR